MFSPSCPTAPLGSPSRHRLGPAGDPVEISPPAGLGSSDPGPVPPLGWGLVVEMMQAPHVKAALDEIGAATWCLPNDIEKRRGHLLAAIYNLDLAVRCGECVDRSGSEAARVADEPGRSAHGQPIGASEAPGEGTAVVCAGGPAAEVTDPPSASRSVDQPTRLWFVGCQDRLGTAWEFQGVFTDVEDAVEACGTEQHFVGPVDLDCGYPAWLGAEVRNGTPNILSLEFWANRAKPLPRPLLFFPLREVFRA